MSVSRRLFLGHLFSAFAAPAIVRAGSLMPVKALDPILFAQNPWGTLLDPSLYGELVAVTRQIFVPTLFVQTYKAMPLMRELALRGIPIHEE
jgi:hypothetical protein